MSWDLDFDEASWFFGPGRDQSTYGLGGALHIVGSDGTVIIVEIVCLSLSPHVENLNLRKVIKVSYLNQESRQCFVFFGFLCVWTFYAYEHYERFYTSVYLYGRIKRSRRYPAKTITDADYADDIAILANAPNQAETLLHSFERAAAGIGLYVNAHKTEYMCYNQTGDISTLKLVDKFTYLGSNVASTEKDSDTRLTKAWTAINRLSIIWKSDVTDKMKRSFFQGAVASILLYGCTTWTLT